MARDFSHICNFCHLCNEMVEHSQCECVCAQGATVETLDKNHPVLIRLDVSHISVERARLETAILESDDWRSENDAVHGLSALFGGDVMAPLRIIRQKYPHMGIRTAMAHVQAILAHRPDQQLVCTSCGAGVPPTWSWCEYCDCGQLTWI